jgi:hypothetical protein
MTTDEMISSIYENMPQLASEVRELKLELSLLNVIRDFDKSNPDRQRTENLEHRLEAVEVKIDYLTGKIAQIEGRLQGENCDLK